VLTTRIAWLVRAGHVSPAGVLAVTFTNKAAREMLTRLAAMLPVHPRGHVDRTFHGLANRMLRLSLPRMPGLPQTFQILDSQDQLAAVKRHAEGPERRRRPLSAARGASRSSTARRRKGCAPAMCR
jgi:DNA helicase-2/ATP-dependent DNA helicase PcrA